MKRKKGRELLSDTSPPVKGKRPDIAEKIKSRHQKVEKVVKCCLKSRFGTLLPEATRACLYNEIENWVLTVSQITHRMSLLVNKTVLYCLTNDIELPDFNQDSFFGTCAKVGLTDNGVRESKQDFVTLIKDVYHNEFHDFPRITRNRGDCQAIQYAANRYGTNFRNATIHAFGVRQEKFLRLWCKRQGIESSHAYRLKCEINGWKVNKPRKGNDPIVFSWKEKCFVKQQQWLLGAPTNLNEAFLKKSSHQVLKYYYYILTCYTEWNEGNKFSLAPISRIKAHSITIDTTTLFEILKNVNIPGAAAVKESKEKHTLWESVLDTRGLKRKMTFGNMIETDGVSLSVHFHWTKKSEKKRSKRKSYKRQAREETSQRLISIDPGRSNLIKGYDWEFDRCYSLTRRTFYTQSGINKRFQKTRRWDIATRPITEALSRHPIRSIEEKDIYLYLQTIIRNYDRLWRHHTQLKRRRLDFTTYAGKNKVLDLFFNTMIVSGNDVPRIAYGASRINPTGKGEMSVPVKCILKKCRERFQTDMEDEHCSTKMCYECESKTHGVQDKKTKVQVRGLRWCSTCRKFIDRDLNACKNIGRSFMMTKSNGRPKYLTRNQPETMVVRRDLAIADKRTKSSVSHRWSAADRVTIICSERKQRSCTLRGA